LRSSAGHLSAAAGAVIAAAITAAITIFQQFLIPDISRFSHAAVIILLMVFLLEWEDRGCGKQRFSLKMSVSQTTTTAANGEAAFAR